MSLRQSFMHILGLAADLVGVRTCAVCGDELLPGEHGCAYAAWPPCLAPTAT